MNSIIVSRANHTQAIIKNNEQNNIYGDNESTLKKWPHNPDKNYNILFQNGLKMIQDMRNVSQN